MATVNFSVPDDVKESFNATFEGQNKSAIVAELMREAIARAEKQQRSHRAIRRILNRRKSTPVASDARLKAARERDRP